MNKITSFDALLRATTQVLLTGLLLILVGCTPSPSHLSDAPAQQALSAEQYLALARGANGNVAIAYRLRAAEDCLRSDRVEKAGEIFREIQMSDTTDPMLKNKILEARLALLKQDVPHTLALLQEMISSMPGPSSTVNSLAQTNSATNTTQKKIALLLPSKGPHAEAAKTIRDGFFSACYKTNQQQTSHASVTVYDTGETGGVEAAYQRAIADHVDMIVGPLTKSEVQTIASLPTTVPVLALNTIGNNKKSSTLYQFGLMPEDEVWAVAEHAKRQGHKQALIIAPQNEWGQRMSQTFKKAWLAQGGHVAQTLILKNADHETYSAEIEAVLQTAKKMPRQDIDMIFLAASPEFGRKIKPMLSFYGKNNLAVYATANVYTGTPTPTKDIELEGIRFCDMPWVLNNTDEIRNAREALAKVWPNSFSRAPRYFALGIDAYHLVQQLNDTRFFPASGTQGTTGTLHLEGQRIQRSLSCAKFENGVPVPD